MGIIQTDYIDPDGLSRGGLLDCFCRLYEDRLRDGQPKGLSRLHVDDELEFGRLFDG